MTAMMLDDATILYGQRIDRYFYLAGIVLLTYDHLLAFQSEVRYIWTSGHRKASAWYLFVRYFALCANAIMFTLAFGDIPAKSYSQAAGDVFVRQEDNVHHFSCCHNRNFSGYLVDLPFRAFLGGSYESTRLPYGYFAPEADSSAPIRMIIRLALRNFSLGMAGGWEGVLATDLIFLGLTLYRGYQRSREGTVLPIESLWRVLVRDGVLEGTVLPIGSLWRVLIRDGVILICLANLANILRYYFGDVRAYTRNVSTKSDRRF
ncbi:hypothetical protein B0H19DRAFT_1266741 [Mycena capillaripes]|nr:hypothetical protein B0H19DRAFT_1266741 [Mycena capillaripes]